MDCTNSQLKDLKGKREMKKENYTQKNSMNEGVNRGNTDETFQHASTQKKRKKKNKKEKYYWFVRKQASYGVVILKEHQVYEVIN